MKRFVFGLERLKRLRDLRRREARARLARAIAETRSRTAEREGAVRELDAACRFELPEESASDPRALQQRALWIDGRRRSIEEARVREEQAAETERALAREHTEHAQRHRVLERLRERRFQRWNLEVEREEQQFLDEAHLLRRVSQSTDETKEI